MSYNTLARASPSILRTGPGSYWSQELGSALGLAEEEVDTKWWIWRPLSRAQEGARQTMRSRPTLHLLTLLLAMTVLVACEQLSSWVMAPTAPTATLDPRRP